MTCIFLYFFRIRPTLYNILVYRRWYHVTSYILFIFNVVVGVFAGLKRILLSLVLCIIRLGRLDTILIMRDFERLDAGVVYRLISYA